VVEWHKSSGCDSEESQWQDIKARIEGWIAKGGEECKNGVKIVNVGTEAEISAQSLMPLLERSLCQLATTRMKCLHYCPLFGSQFASELSQLPLFQVFFILRACLCRVSSSAPEGSRDNTGISGLTIYIDTSRHSIQEEQLSPPFQPAARY